MREIVIRKTLWECRKCGTQYKRKSDARSCEKKGIEDNPFKLGEQVQNVEGRQCGLNEKVYFFKGKITRAQLAPPDEEYERKWLGSDPKRLKSHIYVYQVSFTCPNCRQEEYAGYCTPELKLI